MDCEGDEISISVLKMVRIINEMKEDMNKHLNKNQREYE
jgi:hypothetical protein